MKIWKVCQFYRSKKPCQSHQRNQSKVLKPQAHNQKVVWGFCRIHKLCLQNLEPSAISETKEEEKTVWGGSFRRIGRCSRELFGKEYWIRIFTNLSSIRIKSKAKIYHQTNPFRKKETCSVLITLGLSNQENALWTIECFIIIIWLGWPKSMPLIN
jgi:hypothetical protein